MILVCRRHYPHVDLDGLDTAQTFELPLLQDAQEFRLKFERHVADLVQKSVPPSAVCKRPFAGAHAPVKAPLSWPKSSLSSKAAGIAAQFRAIKRWLRRGLAS